MDYKSDMWFMCCRGEKAFCSSDCRSEQIQIEEEKEKSITETLKESDEHENGDHIFEMFAPV